MVHGSIRLVMGTRLDVILFSSSSVTVNALWEVIVAKLELWEKMLNRFSPQSEVSFLNKRLAIGQDMEVTEEFWNILLLCRQYYEKTLRLFDITLKDFSQIQFGNNRRVSSIRCDIALDFGGFAKGYAALRIREMLTRMNIKNAFINFGDSAILGIGHHPYGNCWKVSFPNPYNSSTVDEFELYDASLSTSGNTPLYTGHIVYPLTGIANQERKACAIVSSDPLDAEVLSTVWMIANEREKEQISHNFKTIRTNTYLL